MASLAEWYGRFALRPRYRRSAAAGKRALVAAPILAYIWKIQFAFYYFPAFILAFILLTLPLDGDKPATWGRATGGRCRFACRQGFVVLA